MKAIAFVLLPLVLLMAPPTAAAANDSNATSSPPIVTTSTPPVTPPPTTDAPTTTTATPTPTTTATPATTTPAPTTTAPPKTTTATTVLPKTDAPTTAPTTTTTTTKTPEPTTTAVTSAVPATTVATTQPPSAAPTTRMSSNETPSPDESLPVAPRSTIRGASPPPPPSAAGQSAANDGASSSSSMALIIGATVAAVMFLGIAAFFVYHRRRKDRDDDDYDDDRLDSMASAPFDTLMIQQQAAAENNSALFKPPPPPAVALSLEHQSVLHTGGGGQTHLRSSNRWKTRKTPSPPPAEIAMLGAKEPDRSSSFFTWDSQRGGDEYQQQVQANPRAKSAVVSEASSFTSQQSMSYTDHVNALDTLTDEEPKFSFLSYGSRESRDVLFTPAAQVQTAHHATVSFDGTSASIPEVDSDEIFLSQRSDADSYRSMDYGSSKNGDGFATPLYSFDGSARESYDSVHNAAPDHRSTNSSTESGESGYDL
ncbi:Aste57867_24031 [Aphanomyces stellatus]|uniref:Aste57867_24031 protein n=1 Tax=Aphanomyces stellatus TaxID=120398 RepID=A0A485LQF6_9STRA|nr:hypothetical protein As57867_023958 [Aphanomyces stellatus]VFU00674.1 Aste57867_24031 [Aphanomyces stellatus]